MQIIDLHIQDLFNFENIFNPAVIRNADGTFLLICRLQNHAAEGYLGLCTLDNTYKPLQTIAIHKESLQMKSRAEVMLEDPRIFQDGDKTYLYHVESGAKALYFCYTVFGLIDRKGTMSEQVVIDYKKNGSSFNTLQRIGKLPVQKTYPLKDWIVEKNWQFFISANKYYGIYKAGRKHQVFCFDFPGGSIRAKYITYNHLVWNYGRISGGAAPVLHPDGYFYSFFHSWTTWEKPLKTYPWHQRKYHIGVYVFENEPPFRIKMISEKPILSGSDFDAIAESGHAVVFPGSALFDEKTGTWIIAIGWNDRSCKMLEIEHADILKELTGVNQLPVTDIVIMESRPVIQKIRQKAGRFLRSFKTSSN